MSFLNVITARNDQTNIPEYRSMLDHHDLTICELVQDTPSSIIFRFIEIIGGACKMPDILKYTN